MRAPWAFALVKSCFYEATVLSGRRAPPPRPHKSSGGTA